MHIQTQKKVTHIHMCMCPFVLTERGNGHLPHSHSFPSKLLKPSLRWFFCDPLDDTHRDTQGLGPGPHASPRICLPPPFLAIHFTLSSLHALPFPKSQSSCQGQLAWCLRAASLCHSSAKGLWRSLMSMMAEWGEHEVRNQGLSPRSPSFWSGSFTL